MWVAEMLRDAPRGAWAAVIASWLRTAALAGCAIALGSTLDAALNDGSLLGPVVAAIALAIVGALAGAVAEALPGRIQAEQEHGWRRRLIGAALDGNITAKSGGHGPARSPEGVIADAATGGVEKIAGYRATFLAPTFASFTAPLLVLVAWAVGIHPLSGLALLAFVVLVPAVIVLAAKWLRTSNAEYRRREARAASRYAEMLEGLGTMKVLGAFPRVWRDYAGQARSAMRELGRLLARNQTTIIVNDAVFGVLMAAAAIALLLGQLATGHLSTGQGLAGLLLTVLLVEPIDRVGRTFYVGLAGRARRDQVEGMLGASGGARPAVTGDTTPATRDATSAATSAPTPAATPAPTPESQASNRPEPPIPAADPSAPPAPALEVRNVTVDLGRGRMLDDVSLRIPAGAHVSIVGPSGAGKSTLIRVLAGLVEPNTGSVLLDDAPASPVELRAAMRLVGQHGGILSTTIADNLRLADPSASDDELRSALDRAHLADEIAARGGVHATVGDAGAQLSGGQRRRLVLARALLRERRILLLDEATADLDRRTEALVRDTLHAAARGRTVVQVAHRLDMTLHSDLVVVVDGGRIVAQGTPDELRARDGYYRRALAAQEARA